MNYCVLLDAIANEAKPVQARDGEKLMDLARRLIDCKTLQLLPFYPDRLPAGYDILCDENVYGKFNVINPIASWLYGTDIHGTPVFRNAVVAKISESEEDITLMTGEDAAAVAEALNAVPGDRMDEVFLKILCQYGAGE